MTKLFALIIEDDPETGKILSVSLQSKFETEIITNGDAALSKLAQVIPALIILDLHLPNVSGIDILAQIRVDRRFDGTRIILCTADALRAESLRKQADFVLLKPISTNQLRELASRLVDSS
jgi:two-component system alkaline phosphatase synthesis response regulator PhoP